MEFSILSEGPPSPSKNMECIFLFIIHKETELKSVLFDNPFFDFHIIMQLCAVNPRLKSGPDWLWHSINDKWLEMGSASLTLTVAFALNTQICVHTFS